MKKLMKKIGSIVFVAVFIATIIFPMNTTNEVKAAAPYYVQVNKNTNVVTVFQNKVNGVYKNPIKAFVCSVGMATPSGTFYTQAKYRWHTLMGPSYGQYCTRIVGGFLFHSVWYYENGKNDTISVAQYNRLGTTASHGCIRLTVADAKWIYDNCPIGTEVTLMSGTSKNDPLGKPKAMKLNTNKRTDWCPTDPDPRNPYRKKVTEITGVKNTTISVGKEFDPKEGIKAISKTGAIITDQIEIKGSVDTTKVGTYTLTYQVSDGTGNLVTKKRKITVKDNTNVIISAKDQVVQLGKGFLALKGVIAKTKAGSNCNASLKVTGKVNTNKVGTYTLVYSATAKNGKTAKKSVKITVKDMKKPTLLGVKNHTLLTTDTVTGSSINLRNGITAKASNGKDLTNRIQVEGIVEPKKAGTYKVTYTVANDSGIKTTKIAIYTIKEVNSNEDNFVNDAVKENVIIKGMKNYTFYGAVSEMSDEERILFIHNELLKNISVFKNGVEQAKDKIKIQVQEQDLNEYKVNVSFGNEKANCTVYLAE